MLVPGSIPGRARVNFFHIFFKFLSFFEHFFRLELDILVHFRSFLSFLVIWSTLDIYTRFSTISDKLDALASWKRVDLRPGRPRFDSPSGH